MKQFILLQIFSCVLLTTTYSQTPIGQEIYGDMFEDASGYSISLSEDGQRLAVGAPFNDGGGSNSGYVRVYELDGEQWVQLGNSILGESINDQFGFSVALSANGGRLIAGSVRNDNIGQARIFELIEGIWQQVGQSLGGIDEDEFGHAVAISSDGNKIAVGAPRAGTGPGSSFYVRGRVFLYEYDGSSWVEMGTPIWGEASVDYFGRKIDLSSNGDIIAVGAENNDGNGNQSGHVRLFQYDGSNWIQMGQDIDGKAPDDHAGSSLAISADGLRVAVGAKWNDDLVNQGGHVRVYDYDGANWNQIGADLYGDYNIVNGNLFGFSCDMSADGNTLIVGSKFQSRGRAYIFKYNGTEWQRWGNNLDGNYTAVDFGTSVTIGGDKVAAASDGTLGIISGDPLGDTYVRAYVLSGISGRIYNDLDEDCQLDSLENGIGNRTITIQPGNIVAQTFDNGNWFVDSLAAGTYTVTIDTLGPWTPGICPISQSFTVTNSEDNILGPSIGLISTAPCASPNIDIIMPTMRACFTNQNIHITACNTNYATEIIDDGYVIVTLDSLITPTSSSMPYTNLGDNQYQFEVGDLYPGECEHINIKCTIDCNTPLGHGICMNAELYPLEDCFFDTIPDPFPPTVDPCDGIWDGSDLVLKSTCRGDSVIFEITNIGLAGFGDMTCFSPVTVYVNGNAILLDSVMLAGGEIAVFAFEGQGQSWYMEVSQHPMHPGNSFPSAIIENCGESTVASRVAEYRLDDADPIIDIYCNVITGSYDPNDKTGFPLGITEDHLILPDQQIQYLIRFQNTGTDTAFTVVVRDTLEEDLGIFSFREGGASHDYDFRMYGPRILEWTFNNIMLPDSTTNEPESNGFLSFKISPIEGLSNGVELNNRVGIYFDFNDPIITNTTSHIIDDMIGNPNVINTVVLDLEGCGEVEYNGAVYYDEGTYYQFSDDFLTVYIINVDLETDIDVSSCESYTSPLGNTYTESGVYQEIISTEECDSIVNIHLIINEPSTSVLEITSCDFYTSPAGNIYQESGIYQETTINHLGCDSLIEIDLYIPEINSNVLVNDYILEAAQDNAEYQWIDCDNGFIDVLGATGQSFEPEASGNYAVRINVDGCDIESECHYVTSVSNMNFLDKHVRIYPNPNNGEFLIDLGNDNKSVDVELFNITGQKIFSQHYEESSVIHLNTNEAKGFYFLSISDSNGNSSSFKIIIE